ncbi:uncharacterized protein VP01_381g4 [Puccinia sorghi]|uniref:Uncharacterized protein n=1 Tax=Puccinia sorghi TaxID=27349 RepID=A0A0L6UTE3_9BASI|nr:uncharacterized protein VP01_381g4 [Puccinia sorghi]
MDQDPLFTKQDPLREARQLDEGVCTSNDPIGCSVPELNSTLAPPQCEFFLSSLVPISAGQPSPPCEIWTDAEIVDVIRWVGPADQGYTALMDSALSPASQHSNPKLLKYSVEHRLLFHGHQIVVAGLSTAVMQPTQHTRGGFGWTKRTREILREDNSKMCNLGLRKKRMRKYKSLYIQKGVYKLKDEAEAEKRGGVCFENRPAKQLIDPNAARSDDPQKPIGTRRGGSRRNLGRRGSRRRTPRVRDLRGGERGRRKGREEERGGGEGKRGRERRGGCGSQQLLLLRT